MSDLLFMFFVVAMAFILVLAMKVLTRTKSGGEKAVFIDRESEWKKIAYEKGRLAIRLWLSLCVANGKLGVEMDDSLNPFIISTRLYPCEICGGPVVDELGPLVFFGDDIEPSHICNDCRREIDERRSNA